jgi:transcriptional regulator with XRE-family HTH domain
LNSIQQRCYGPAEELSNTLEGMAGARADGYGSSVNAIASSDQFASELRRWRTSRRWSQLELALRAGTTQRHLSFMEQGRSRPGRAMVVRLAESLELSLRERNALLLSAGYAPIFKESRLDDEALRPIREALERVLDGHLPYPAVLVRPFGAQFAVPGFVAVDLA